jgi:predicted DCC family thiol-disulfide oxidoreductase YuxK
MSNQRSDSHQTLIFFDGVCGLCNRWVDWLVIRDQRRDRLRFASLQSEAAQLLLTNTETQDLDSIVVVTSNGAKLRKSDAVLAILGQLGTVERLFAKAAQRLPLGLRDSIYDIVAKYRYLVFGKRDICRLPTPSERHKFLDS